MFLQETNLFAEELVRPILACFLDTDSRVRYYACESLYNVAKVGRGALLPQFNEVFDVLAKLVADPDQNVKSGAELLDRLLKVGPLFVCFVKKFYLHGIKRYNFFIGYCNRICLL